MQTEQSNFINVLPKFIDKLPLDKQAERVDSYSLFSKHTVAGSQLLVNRVFCDEVNKT